MGDRPRGRLPAGPTLPPRSPALDVTLYFWLVLVATVVAMVARHSRIPYAIALVVTGLAIGAPRLIPKAHLEPHTLLTVFLPPLLFEASINLRLEALRRYWRSIALFAAGGTVLTTVVVGAGSSLLLGLPLPVAWVFGALISPTDPISVIAVFRRLGVRPRLALLVEAESLFNDGVGVVLFSVLLAAAHGSGVTVWGVVLPFITLAAGGAAVGAGIGWLASRVTHEFDDHLLEIMLTTVAAWGAYLGAEALHVSGVMAVVAAGLLVGNYGMQSGMTPMSRLAVISFWEYAAFAANSILFLLLGIEVTVVNLGNHIGPVAVAVLLVLGGRLLSVLVLTPLAGRWEARIPRSWPPLLVWAGLRGALSMALVLGLDPGFPYRDTVIVLTFGVVVVSLLLQGTTIGRLVRWLGLGRTESRVSEYRKLSAERLACQAAIQELERLRHRGALARWDMEAVREEYVDRLEHAETCSEELQARDPTLHDRVVGATRRVALLAEKSALYDAERRGILEPDSVRELVDRIDALLAELDAGRPEG